MKKQPPGRLLRRLFYSFMRAYAWRDLHGGLLGAIDEDDLEHIVSLVADLKVVQMPGGHEIHLVQPGKYIEELTKFVDELRAKNKLH